jgi:hypothetical protein
LGKTAVPKIEVANVVDEMEKKSLVSDFGSLQLEMFLNEEPTIEVETYVYMKNSLISKQSMPKTLNLPVGDYDIKIIEQTTKAEQWLRGIQIKKGKTVERSLNFFSGSLLSQVTVNKELTTDANVYVYRSGEHKHFRKGSASKIIRLPVGTYDIKVVERTMGAEQWLYAVEVDKGKLRKQQFDFLRAGFQVWATINRELTTEAHFNIYSHDSKFSNRKVQAQLEQPQIIYVSPGTYDIETTSFGIQKTKWARDIEVKAGDLRSLEFNFSLSGVLVGVKLNGVYTDNANIEIYPAGKKQFIRRIRSSQREEVRIILPPGRYDLRAVDFDQRNDEWHKGILLAEGKIIKQHFNFKP